jgi:hypothetical protein
MMMPPRIDLLRKEDRRAVARERHGLFRCGTFAGPVCDAHPSKIFGSGIPIMSPGPEYSDA